MTNRASYISGDLCHAAFNGEIAEMQRILAAHPASINDTYIDLNVMAHALSSQKRDEVVKFLVNDAGLNAEQLQKLWWHAPKDCHQLQIACTENRADIADIILQYDKSELNAASKTNENTLLMRTLGMGANTTELVGVLIKHGADTTMIDSLGNTCLHHAALGNLDSLKAHFDLFEGQLNTRNKAKKLPLHHALFRKNAEMIEFLFDMGTEIDDEIKNGDMNLLEKCFAAKEQALNNAIARGVDAIQNGSKQKTPVMRKIALKPRKAS